MESRSPHALRRYYEWNTALFLRLSGGRSTQSLHRPVWAEDVQTQDEAFAYPYRLVLRALRHVASTTSEATDDGNTCTTDTPQNQKHPYRILDLGCGVGGAVQYLLDHFHGPLHGTGVTLSPTQVERARQLAQNNGLDSDRYTFAEADFHDLPPLHPVDVAFAIEAFALAEGPEPFLSQATRVLRPGGRLVLIDDFFAQPAPDRHLSASEQKWVETVRNGWHAHGLCSVSATVEAAKAEGLRLVRTDDLTSSLVFDRPRDRLIKWGLVPLRPLLWRWPYFRGLIGGDALQNCLKEGIIEYRHLVFERAESA